MKRIPVVLDTRGQLIEQLSGSSVTVSDVCTYLKGHPVVLSARGVAPDRVSVEGRVIPICFYTDGVWLWSNELAEYVCRYALGVPSEFLDYLGVSGVAPRHVSEAELSTALSHLRPGAA